MNVLLVITVLALPIIVFAQASSSGTMNSTFSNMATSLGVIVGVQDIHKIKDLVDEFLELRKIRDTPQAEIKAHELDQKINDLVLVEMYCAEKISSLYLAYSSNPYSELQKNCPKLSSLEFSKAVATWQNLT